jgi:hypothetical protein
MSKPTLVDILGAIVWGEGKKIEKICQSIFSPFQAILSKMPKIDAVNSGHLVPQAARANSEFEHF